MWINTSISQDKYVIDVKGKERYKQLQTNTKLSRKKKKAAAGLKLQNLSNSALELRNWLESHFFCMVLYSERVTMQTFVMIQCKDFKVSYAQNFLFYSLVLND